MSAGLDSKEAIIRRRLRDDLLHYARRCLKIRTKAGGATELQFNRAQQLLHKHAEAQLGRIGRVRLLVLKGRQMGVSTYIEARLYWKTSHRRGVRAFILTHRDQATQNLFTMAKRFHASCPRPVRPRTGASNLHELVFKDLDSGYRVATAKAPGVGRSDTIQYFHGSEVAFWPNAEEHMAGALQAVPEVNDSEIWLESTANGSGGLFYDLCRSAEKGLGDYELVFLPWYLDPFYRRVPPKNWRPPTAFESYGQRHQLSPDQIYWAYCKNAELAMATRTSPETFCWKFKQEYPGSIQEAFQSDSGASFISSEIVEKARLAQLPEPGPVVPLVLGVDVARGGGDFTRVIDRHGRRYGHRINQRIDSRDLMQIAGIVARQIERIQPDRVFIDATGGYGSAVVDRLCELGFGDVVLGVEFAGRANDDSVYANKRAEIWGRLRDHLNEPGGCDLADDEELHRHICAPGHRFDSSGRLLLEGKDKIKSRLGFSPDAGDAAALTHAEPVRKFKPRFSAARTAEIDERVFSD
ncbi:hypothetical protein [Limibacillus sp. MBR-115]|jgi:hypothetical protein|uniref:hypothetical protein n=1 Tax=Limibacillus sp. MBR-115 TaxID=3156465 RepID=UPI00339B11D6